MKSSRKDIINVALLIENDLSRALGKPCLLYQESGMCQVHQVDSIGRTIRSLSGVYDAKTLHKVVIDLITVIGITKGDHYV